VDRFALSQAVDVPNLISDRQRGVKAPGRDVDPDQDEIPAVDDLTFSCDIACPESRRGAAWVEQ
jgi:hypothetical protein